MKYYVYITPSELHRQLTCTVDLAKNAIELPSAELEELIRSTIAPFTPLNTTTKNNLFKAFTVDGMREVGRTGLLPTPAWLGSEETKDAIVGHQPMLGSINEFLWSEFLSSVLSRRWPRENEWAVNAQGLGYPRLNNASEAASAATFGENKTPLRQHLPKEWTLFHNQTHAHLCVTHPGLVNASMHDFLEIAPKNTAVFPARTHPLFYVALYEFWKYLCSEPTWAHLSPAIMVDENRDTPDFSAQSLVNFGLGAATCRWGWWSLISHVFAPRSRALDILAQFHPACYEGNQLSPRPSNMEMNTTTASPPPRLRVLNDPYGR